MFNARLYLFRLLIFIFSTVSFTVKAQNEPVRILSYNILEGMSLDSTENKSTFVDWIKKVRPDIIALQEAQGLTQQSLEGLARKFDHPYAVLSKEEGYPVALTSRFPIINVSKVIDNMHHGFIMAEIKEYKIMVVHLSPNKFRKRKEEAELLISTVKSHPQASEWLIMGDFNALSPADSSHYADGRLLKNMRRREAKNENVENLVNRHLDYSVIQKFLKVGLLDAFKLTNDNFDHSIRTKLFFENSPGYAEKRIDYIFVSKNLKEKVLNTKIVKDEFTHFHSDHYPILLDLSQ